MTLLLATDTPIAAVPAPLTWPAPAVTTEVSVAITLMVPRAVTSELLEICASMVLTMTLTDTEPPKANLPAPAPPTVTAVTTAAEEAFKLTPEDVSRLCEFPVAWEASRSMDVPANASDRDKASLTLFASFSTAMT